MQRRLAAHEVDAGRALPVIERVDGARALIAASRLPIGVTGGGQAFQLVAGESLEQALCDEALAAGLLLSPHDNQLPSAALDDAAVAEALSSLQQALAAVAGRLPSLVGAPLTTEAVWSSAWNQMDGLPFGPAAAARDFIARRLAS